MEKTVLTIGDECTELISKVGPETEKEEAGRVPRGQDKGRVERKRETSAGLAHCLAAKTSVVCNPNSLTFVRVNRQRGMIRVQPLDEESTCQPLGGFVPKHRQNCNSEHWE
jgi:hypothetical protein